jgi:hypothetical protein
MSHHPKAAVPVQVLLLFAYNSLKFLWQAEANPAFLYYNSKQI